MVSVKLIKALNEQIALEGYASFLYLSMSAWCDRQGLIGCRDFMRRQSEEERMHMLKIFDYISDVDADALTPAVKEPPHKFESVQTMFETTYAHEQKVTNSIHKLIALATQEDDFTTINFLQWYVTEQREEEALMRTILDKIRLIGDGPQHLYYIDKEVSAINALAMKAEAVE